MPEVDGLEATRRLRARETETGRTRVPVVALTAHALDGDRDTCIAAGMDDYLTKPFTQQQLLERIQHWTGTPTREARPRRDSSAPSSPSPYVDVSALENLRTLERQTGKSGIVEKVIGLYGSSSVELIASMTAAIAGSDPVALAEAAHSLKTASANVGGTRVAELCRSLEAMGRSEDLTGAADALARLRAEQEQLREALHHEVDGVPA